MKITVCQLHDDPDAFADDWERLVAHVSAQKSDLVLLPEMPFFRWFPLSRAFDAAVWQAAVAAHTAGERRLAELAPAAVLGTRPIDFGAVRYSAGFVWHAEEGIETIHAKAYLSREAGAWESTWYHKAVPEFVPATIGDATVGMLIGSELWVMEQARVYGEDDVHIIAVPRVTGDGHPPSATSIWVAGGCAAAVISGAYCISSSRAADGAGSGGPGWIISPDGIPLATTSDARPFVSADVDLVAADKAKETYPRSVIFDISVHRPLPPAPRQSARPA